MRSRLSRTSAVLLAAGAIVSSCTPKNELSRSNPTDSAPRSVSSSADASAPSPGVVRVYDASHKYGFVDRAGRVVLAPQLESLGSFSKGLASAEHQGRWGFLNVRGE